MLSNPNQDYWAPFCRAIGKNEWIEFPSYATMESRTTNNEELIKKLDEIFASRTWDEWEKSFKEHDVIFGVNQTPSEIIKDEQAIANGFFADVDHPIAGKIRLVNSPVKFSDTPAKIESVAPPLGAHTEEVLLEIGYNWESIAQFKEQGVIL